MLDLPRYLLGAAEIGVLVGFAWLGASALRSRLLPTFSGAPAYLATAVIGLALLLWIAGLLGSFGLFELWVYLGGVAVVGAGLWLLVGGGWGHPHTPSHREPATRRAGTVAMTIGLVLAVVAVVKFAAEVKIKLGTGMTGFDSTWYHGPFAAGFFQSGDTWDLHFIAPQFLAWFYPANSELFHAIGMLGFDRDILSPLLNLGWFVGCLVACWCIGRPYGVAPWSLALGAIALSVPALSDQAGEARNDIVGIFFLLAAVAIAVNAWTGTQAADRGEGDRHGEGGVWSQSGPPTGALVVVGLATGLAAGTKLNFLPPAAVLVLGLPLLAPGGRRARALAATSLAALAGGGYWYLRNLVHAGNPLPWVDRIGPISLPAPEQALGGREGHSVLGYLTDGTVWADWLLPGFHDGLWAIWPLLLAAALASLVLCLIPLRHLVQRGGEGSDSDRVLVVVGLAGLAAVLAWLIAPTSASGPEGMPRGFESGLRYLAPALVLGLVALPAALLPRVARWRGSPIAQDAQSASEHMGEGRRDRTRGLRVAAAVAMLVVVAVGYPVQRHYLDHRYADPSFSEGGLNAAFAWARNVSGARIATTSTRQYPLFGTDLSNEVTFVGVERPHGGFVAASTCRAWRRLLDAGGYDYVVASRDRPERGKPPFPPAAAWTEGPGAKVVLREPPTVVFRVEGRAGAASCR